MAERQTLHATLRYTPPVDVLNDYGRYPGSRVAAAIQPSHPQMEQWHERMAALRLQLRGQRWLQPTSLLAPDIGFLGNRNATECSPITLPCQESMEGQGGNQRCEASERTSFPQIELPLPRSPSLTATNKCAMGYMEREWQSEPVHDASLCDELALLLLRMRLDESQVTLFSMLRYRCAGQTLAKGSVKREAGVNPALSRSGNGNEMLHGSKPTHCLDRDGKRQRSRQPKVRRPACHHRRGSAGR